jgi:hypothetical protein
LNKIAAANSKYANKIQYSFSTYADKYYEINVYLNNVSNNISSDFLEPGKYVIIKFNYSSSINPMEAQTLKVITLDENNSEWIRSDINQENDYTSKTISAYINHFSIWSYAPSVFSDLSQLIVYPNPWNINTAGIVSETVNYGVKFYGLPKNSNVKIYTVAGEKVYQGTNGTVDTLVWNLRNAEGVKVASGVYLYVVDYNGQKVTGKIAVIK